MMLSKSSCPKCKATIENWHTSYVSFGNPFVRCKSCMSVIRFSHVNEWEAMPISSKLQYHWTVYGGALIYGIGGALLLGIVFESIFKIGIFIQDDNPTIAYIPLMLVLSIISLIYGHVEFIKSIEKSKKRTADKAYRRMLGIES